MTICADGGSSKVDSGKPNECTLSTRVQNPCDLEFGTQDCTTMLLSGQCRAEHCSRFERPVAVHPDQMEMFGDG